MGDAAVPTVTAEAPTRLRDVPGVLNKVNDDPTEAEASESERLAVPRATVVPPSASDPATTSEAADESAIDTVPFAVVDAKSESVDTDA
jgi:hypothetical protein